MAAKQAAARDLLPQPALHADIGQATHVCPLVAFQMRLTQTQALVLICQQRALQTPAMCAPDASPAGRPDLVA